MSDYVDGTAQIMVSQMESASDVHLLTPFSAFLELVMDNQKDHAGTALQTVHIQFAVDFEVQRVSTYSRLDVRGHAFGL